MRIYVLLYTNVVSSWFSYISFPIPYYLHITSSSFPSLFKSLSLSPSSISSLTSLFFFPRCLLLKLVLVVLLMVTLMHISTVAFFVPSPCYTRLTIQLLQISVWNFLHFPRFQVYFFLFDLTSITILHIQV